MKKTIVSIVSLGHSGSTLLGNILGSHSKGIHIGELVAPLQKNRPVICRECFNKSCPIWGTVIKEKFLYKVYNQYQRGNKSIFEKDYRCSIYKKIFASQVKKQFLVDSSKIISWYRYNTNIKKYNYKYIFLKRNIAAVFSSLRRSYNKDIVDFKMQTEVLIDEINTFYNSIQEKNKCVVSYEDITNNIDFYINEICYFLNVDFQKSMINFNEIEHHLIGGNHAHIMQKSNKKLLKLEESSKFKTNKNVVNYYSSFSGIKEDIRWKNELTKSEIEFILNETENFIF